MLKKYSIFREVNNILSNNEFEGKYQEKIKEFLNSKNNLKYYNFEKIENLENIEKNKQNNKGFFILANHNNGLNDSVLINTIIDSHTITSKKFIDSFNFYSPIPKEIFLKRLKCIQYERDENDEDILNFEDIRNIIIEKINNKENILFFPEKDMSNKNSLSFFRYDSFKIAFSNKIPILPIIIKYNNKEYFNKQNEIDRSILNTTDTQGIDIHLLDFIYPDQYQSIEELYNYTFNIMNNYYNIC